MRTQLRFLAVGLAVLLLAVMIAPAVAQDEVPGPGEGAPIYEPNFGGDPTNLNPLLISDGSSQDVADRLFPWFVQLDPATAAIIPGVRGSLATGWDVSEDGRVYTFHLRDDWAWSDGTPITSADVKYAFDAIESGEIETPLTIVADSIASVETPDERTVVITYEAADCTALNVARNLPVIPAHVFTELFGTDYAAMNDAEWNLNPTVTAGEFVFSNFPPRGQANLFSC